MEPNAAAPLVKKFDSSLDELLAWMTSADFYIEILAIALAISVSWLLSLLIKRRTKLYLERHPPKRLDLEFYVKPLSLLTPFFAVLILNALLPIAREHEGGIFIQSFIALSMAWLIAKTIILYVQSRFVAFLLAVVIMIITALNVTGFMKSTESYLESVVFDIGKFKLSMLGIINGLVMLIVVFWLAGALSRTLESYLRKASSLSYNTRELFVKFFRIFIYFIALMITLSSIGVDLTAFAVFGGALGVGIGLGLQKITANFVSGITLLMEKSIKIGDLIEIGDISGWVRQLNIRYALIECFDGKEVLIPNEELVSTRVTNWTYSNDRARIDIPVAISYDSDFRLAQKLILEAATEHKLCLKSPTPNCFMRQFADSSLNFTLTFWIRDVKEGRLGPQSDVMFAILDKFKTNGIVIPYPHQVQIEYPQPGTKT
ncbi:MAG: mechanosensitive ion channel [Rickettsiales bacterium]|nr:mechanosensitive ion channel [Rickettsiales bacterium]